MPARKNPVSARQPSKAPKDPADPTAATVHSALAAAHSRNTRRAEKRSAMASSANTSVPAMKPSCSADVKVPTSAAAQPNSRCSSGMTAFTANQGEVPANCASTITGNTRLGAMVVACAPPPCGVARFNPDAGCRASSSGMLSS